MKKKPVRGPQQTFFYRLVAFFSKFQLSYLYRRHRHRDLITILYLFFSGMVALGTITLMAFLTNLMLLFPPLGPSAFILFYTPLSEAASPRNLILSHTVALLSGLGALTLSQTLFPAFIETAPTAMNWPHLLAIVLAMGTVSLGMVLIRCVHPPAAATALIAAMGYLDSLIQIGGVLLAVLLLAMEACLFNRLLGGLPYPVWRFDPKIEKTFRSLAGHPAFTETRWQKLAQKTFHRRQA
ncbi:MAG: HPP family protein [Desulfobacteraceae bacterium]|nr:HPP family protein [Desulfobacteraceae bacterium]